MDTLNTFFKEYLPNIDTTALEQGFKRHRVLKKKEFLLRPNQNADFIAFVEKGTFRVFFYDLKDTDVTVWFSFQGMMISDLLAFYRDTSTRFYIQAIEESEIKIISRDTLEDIYRAKPEYLQFGKKHAEKVACGSVMPSSVPAILAV